MLCMSRITIRICHLVLFLFQHRPESPVPSPEDERLQRPSIGPLILMWATRVSFVCLSFQMIQSGF